MIESSEKQDHRFVDRFTPLRFEKEILFVGKFATMLCFLLCRQWWHWIMVFPVLSTDFHEKLPFIQKRGIWTGSEWCRRPLQEGLENNLLRGNTDQFLVKAYEDVTTPFPQMLYRVFRPRQLLWIGSFSSCLQEKSRLSRCNTMWWQFRNFGTGQKWNWRH